VLLRLAAAHNEASRGAEQAELEDGHEEAAQGDGVIGDVFDRNVVIVDDLVDGAQSYSRLPLPPFYPWCAPGSAGCC
jgi:phosphoribosylpyrophosphate synthetase